MTSELRPAEEVWQEAYGVWGDPSLPDTSEADQAAASVIRAYGDEREAKGRAEQAAELAKFKALAETLAGALEEWDELIKHPYFGSRKAMSDMNYAAQRGLKALREYKETRDAS